MIFSIILYLLFLLYNVITIFYLIVNKEFTFVFHMNFVYLLIGMAVYLIMSVFIRKTKDFFRFLETFTHEYTHLIFSFLTFNKVYSFKSTLHSGGEIRTKKINPIIVLSPYTIPIVPLLLGLLTFIIKDQFTPFFIFFIGFFLMQFFNAVIKDIMTARQPDLKIYGKPLSLMIIFICLIAIILFTLITVNFMITKNIDIIMFFIETVFK